MATDKWVARLEAKLDALLKKAGLDAKDFDAAPAAVKPHKLTPQEQEAIDNAPEAEATIPPAEELPRLTDQNAPSTKSSVPPKAKK